MAESIGEGKELRETGTGKKKMERAESPKIGVSLAKKGRGRTTQTARTAKRTGKSQYWSGRVVRF